MKKIKVKKIIIFSILLSIIIGGALFLIPENTKAIEFNNPLGPNDEDPDNQVAGIIYSIIIWIQRGASIVAVLMVLIGGFMYMLSAGNSGMVEKAKKLLTYTAVGFAVIFGGAAILVEIIKVTGQQGLGTPDDIHVQDADILILEVTIRLVQIIGVLGVLMILVSGVIFMTSESSDRRDLAKKMLQWAIIGIAVSLLAWSIVEMITSIVL